MNPTQTYSQQLAVSKLSAHFSQETHFSQDFQFFLDSLRVQGAEDYSVTLQEDDAVSAPVPTDVHPTDPHTLPHDGVSAPVPTDLYPTEPYTLPDDGVSTPVPVDLYPTEPYTLPDDGVSAPVPVGLYPTEPYTLPDDGVSAPVPVDLYPTEPYTLPDDGVSAPVPTDLHPTEPLDIADIIGVEMADIYGQAMESLDQGSSSVAGAGNGDAPIVSGVNVSLAPAEMLATAPQDIPL